MPCTRLGRILSTGGDRRPVPRDACCTTEDVEATVRLLGRPLTTEEQVEVANLKAQLGKARA